MRIIINILVIAMIALSSHAYTQLIRDGGAKDQGVALVTGANTSALDQLPRYWGALVLLAAVCVLLIGKGRVKKAKLDASLIFLMGLCFLSTIWAKFPIDSFRISLLMSCAYILIYLQVSVCGYASALRLLFVIFLAINISSMLAIALLPSYGLAVGDHLGAWQGVFDHKNGLGNFAVLSFLVSAWEHDRRKSPLTVIGMLLSVVLTVGSASSTAIINLIVVTIFRLCGRYRSCARALIKFRYLAFLSLLSLISIQLYLSLFRPEIPVLFVLGDSTFTGRAAIWLSAMQTALTSPYLGHGIGQFFMVSSIEGDLQSSLGFVVGSTHNGYIDIFFSLGISGLAIVVFMFIERIRNCNTVERFNIYFPFVLMLMALNFSESRLVDFNIFFVCFMYLTHFAAHAAVSTEKSRRT